MGAMMVEEECGHWWASFWEKCGRNGLLQVIMFQAADGHALQLELVWPERKNNVLSTGEKVFEYGMVFLCYT